MIFPNLRLESPSGFWIVQGIVQRDFVFGVGTACTEMQMRGNTLSGHGWKSGLVQCGKAGADASGEQCLVVNLAVRRRGENTQGFQQIALAASVGADENIDQSKIDRDVI